MTQKKKKLTTKHTERRRRDNGKHDGVIMPVPVTTTELPESYAGFLGTLVAPY